MRKLSIRQYAVIRTGLKRGSCIAGCPELSGCTSLSGTLSGVVIGAGFVQVLVLQGIITLSDYLVGRETDGI